MRFKERILLSSPTMHGEEMQFIKEAFDKNWIAPLGFNCDCFEEETAAYLKDKDCCCLALSSGTAALHLAVKLANVKRGDVVFCSDTTFAATVNPISYEGAQQVFIDSEKETWNMDPEALKKAFKKYPQAKVVIMAHLYGTPAKMDELLAICNEHNAILIEDAAEALSATYNGRQCGTFGEYNVLSFNGNKIITSSGGGMLICKQKSARDKALFWATQAREQARHYEHKEIGYNYRMSNVVAGIGRGQLLHLDEHRQKKEEIYFRYKEGLKELPLKMNPYLANSVPNFWLSCALLDDDCLVTPNEIIDALEEANVEARPIWKPMHLQPVFKNNDFITNFDRPFSEQLFAHGVCLPSDIKMTKDQQDKIIQTIKSLF